MSAADDTTQMVSDLSTAEMMQMLSDTMSDQLKPSLTSKTPQEAVDKYFRTRNLKKDTEYTHHSALYNHFVVWCEEVRGFDDMSELTGNDLADYRVWRREEAPTKVKKLRPKSEETQQKILRVFIKRCEQWEFVTPGLHEFIIIPKVSRSDEVREQVLDSQTANQILDWLGRYEYASLHHVIWLLYAESGARLGGIHSLDVSDYVSQRDEGYLKLRHRPKTGTTLKNGEEGERDVSITLPICDVLDDYLDDKRVDQTDEYGRTPLLTTSHGRVSKSTIRTYFYAWTRPCVIGMGCPYGRDPSECDAAKRNNWAYECPDSLSTHPIRKGYITAGLKGGIPKMVLSERCDVSEKILDRHYDFRTEQEKMRARMNLMKMAHQQNPRYGA
ncbi:site-specific integrase [Halorubrum sp. Eb13]|uniref:tyrosine-type recombinase/integrase n=1 Tax=Halorubrum sp. Eb13 TaxID=1383843 RepID=UPI001140249E|nr:site-specific integrase [Halorubrum sp. Eb13]